MFWDEDGTKARIAVAPHTFLVHSEDRRVDFMDGSRANVVLDRELLDCLPSISRQTNGHNPSRC